MQIVENNRVKTGMKIVVRIIIVMMKFCSEIKMTHIKKKLSKRKMTGCA
jgi:hypothetical protein